MSWEHGHSGYSNHKCRCEICKQAVNAYNRSIQAEYRQRPHAKAYQNAYLAEYRLLRQDELHAYSIEYRQLNGDEIRAKERARKRTPEGLRKARRNNENRRARKLGQFIEDVDPLIVWKMHGGCCGICKESVSSTEFHVDHVIPLSKGGKHGYINVQPAHPHCNLAKWAH